MKTTHFSPATRLALSVSGFLFIVLLMAAPITRAVTIQSTITMPDYIANPLLWPKTESNPTFGTFDFSSSYLSLPTFKGLDISLTFFGLDTNTIGFDYNNITLALGTPGHMFDTGVKLNNFGNFIDTNLVFGSPNLAGNSVAILAALQASHGFLTVGLMDATKPPTYLSNPFSYFGGTATMTLADRPIPFEPTQTLGFGVLAALFAFRRFPQLKRFLVRA